MWKRTTARRSWAWTCTRRRSVLVRMAEDGRKMSTARITNSPPRLAAEIRPAGLHPQVVLEACYGWYWAADALAEAQAGAEVHLAHPLGVKAYSHRGSRTTRTRRLRRGRPAADAPGWPRRGSPRRRSASSARGSAS